MLHFLPLWADGYCVSRRHQSFCRRKQTAPRRSGQFSEINELLCIDRIITRTVAPSWVPRSVDSDKISAGYHGYEHHAFAWALLSDPLSVDSGRFPRTTTHTNTTNSHELSIRPAIRMSSKPLIRMSPFIRPAVSRWRIPTDNHAYKPPLIHISSVYQTRDRKVVEDFRAAMRTNTTDFSLGVCGWVLPQISWRVYITNNTSLKLTRRWHLFSHAEVINTPSTWRKLGLLSKWGRKKWKRATSIEEGK